MYNPLIYHLSNKLGGILYGEFHALITPTDSLFCIFTVMVNTDWQDYLLYLNWVTAC